MTAQLAVLFPVPQAKPDFGAMLGATTTTEATKPKKGAAPIITNAPAEVKAAIDEYVDAETTIKKCKAIKEVAGPIVFDFFRQIQDKDGFVGRFASTYAIVGNQATGKVGNKNAYTISVADEGQIAGVLGLENFRRMIVNKPTVTLKAEVFENEAISDKLMGLLGDSFPEFFETKVALAVCEDFNKLVYTVLKPEALENLRVFMRQYNPSIR